MSNETNSTMSPTGAPTLSPTDELESTGAPSLSPTWTPTDDDYTEPTGIPTYEPTPLYTANSTQEKINVIHLPNYKSHDTIDGLFLGVGMFIMFVLLILCLQRINLNNRRNFSE